MMAEKDNGEYSDNMTDTKMRKTSLQMMMEERFMMMEERFKHDSEDDSRTRGERRRELIERQRQYRQDLKRSMEEAISEKEMFENISYQKKLSKIKNDFQTSQSSSNNEQKTVALELSESEQKLMDRILVNPVILETVFSQLSARDIKSVAQVSKTWRDVVEQPKFWNWAKMRLSENNFNERFISQRINIMRSVKATSLSTESVELLLSGGCKFKRLVRLDLTRTDLSSLSADILSKAVINLPEVDLSSTSLRPGQLEDLTTRIIGRRADSRLRRLELAKVSLSSLSSSLLCQLVLSLQEVSLLFCQLSLDHLTALATAIVQAQGPLKLSSLNLTRNDLSSVSRSLLSKALVRLQEATLFQAELTTDHVNLISDAVVGSRNLTLRRLGLSYNNLAFVSPQSFAQAVVRLEEVELRSTKLESQQVRELCQAIVGCTDLKLKRLNLSHNSKVSGVEDCLAEAKGRLHYINTYKLDCF